MRVISGTARGRRLQSVAGMETRPTTDRVKESLFNIISSLVENSRLLDLFAGNGGIGIEALSRGAAQVVFIDKNHRCTQMIKTNLANTSLTGDVYTNDTKRAIEILAKRNQFFDIIFLDPPYGQGLISRTLESIAYTKLLRTSGLIVAEYGKKEEIPQCMWNFFREREESYGDTVLAFFRYKEYIKGGYQ